MSLSRVVYNGLKTLNNSKLLLQKDLFISLRAESFTRNFRKAYPAFLKTMKARRKVAGPDKERKRTEWIDWNYNAELYAFNKRLRENISEENLRSIFVHDSYIKKEEENRKEMAIQEVELNLKSNCTLIALGEEVISNFLSRYLRHCFEQMPEDGIVAVHNYLTSDEIQAYVSSNLGTKDLIFSAEYPPEEHTLAATLKAVVGGIASSDSTLKAETFILDFICPQLIGKDILEIWNIENPVSLLNKVLENQGHERTESRLISESGRNTIESIYQVGVYSDKKFLGKGFGETLAFAEEMAAYDALRRIFKINESMKSLPFGDIARKIKFTSEKEHATIDDLCKIETVKNVVSS